MPPKTTSAPGDSYVRILANSTDGSMQSMLHRTERSLTLTGIFHATEHDRKANFVLRLNLHGRCHFTVFDGETGKVTGNIEFKDKEIRREVAAAIRELDPEAAFIPVPGTEIFSFRHTNGQVALEALVVRLHEIADDANWAEIARTQRLRSEETFNFLGEIANHRLGLLEGILEGITIAVRFEKEEALKAIANLLPKPEMPTSPSGPTPASTGTIVSSPSLREPSQGPS